MDHITTKARSLLRQKFKKWSKQSRELRDKYADDKIEEFKEEMKNLSEIY